MSHVNLANHFLIAMPTMADPNFSRTLTYICEHTPEGALGVIVNRPIDMNLAGLFERIDIRPGPGAPESRLSRTPVYFGGPVQTDHGFVLHRPPGNWHSTLRVNDEIGLTSSLDVIQSMAAGGEPNDVLITLGYAGWAAGQIEWELSQNAWLTVGADPDVIFSLPPEERLAAAMQLLGFDFANLSEVAGHA